MVRVPRTLPCRRKPAPAGRRHPGGFGLAVMLTLAVAVSAAQAADPFDREPINYSSPQTSDPVARLQKAIEAGEVELSYDSRHGYLKSLLDDPIGPYLIVTAVGLQVAGFLIMRRIVNIRV